MTTILNILKLFFVYVAELIYKHDQKLHNICKKNI